MFRQNQARLRLILSAFAFALVLAALVYRTTMVLNVPGEPRVEQWGLKDFRDAIYYPIVAFLDGGNPYDTPNYAPQYPIKDHFPLYSPITLLIHLPLGLLPYEAAEAVYFLGVVLICLLLARLALQFCGIELRAWKVLAVATLILLSRPGHNNLVVGQCAAQAVLFSLVAIQFARTRPALSGIALALSTFKPTFGVPIFLMMLARRDYKACGIALAVGTVGTLLALGVLIANAGGFEPFFDSVIGNNSEFENHPGANPVTSFTRVDTISVLARFTGWNLSTGQSLLWGAGILLLGALAINRLPRSMDEPDGTGLSGAIICLVTLMSIYHQPPDVMLLTVTFLAICIAYGRTWSAVGRPVRLALIACFTLVCVNYLATATFIRLFQMESAVWMIVTSINGIALTAALVICLALAILGRTRMVESTQETLVVVLPQ